MRTIVTVCLGLALAGCAAGDSTCVTAPDGTVRAFMCDPGARQAYRERADDAKCREFGFEPRTEAYGNCRLQLEQIRAIERASVQTRRSAAQPTQGDMTGALFMTDLPFMCKDAISRGDSGAVFIFC